MTKAQIAQIESDIVNNVYYEVHALITDYDIIKPDDAHAIVDHIYNIAQLGQTDSELVVNALTNANIITASTAAACIDLLEAYECGARCNIPILLTAQAI